MSCSSHPPRSRFVEDLIYIVLESSDHWWPGDLVQLAQVSSAWLEPVRRRLFAMPSVHSFRASTRLARTLSSNPSLLSLVKGVELQPMPRGSAHITSQDRASLNFILAISGLQHITLGGLLSVKAERFLHRVADAHSVLSLHIDGRSMTHSLTPAECPSLEWDESIAFHFCNMETLHLTNIELAISFPSIPYQLQLSELHLDHVTITRGYITHLLHETPSLPRLRIRSIQASEVDEQVKCVLDSCAVEMFEYEADVEGPFAHNIFDNNSSSLRILRLVSFHFDFDTLNVIREHCQGLEVLIISGRKVSIPPCEWQTFIQRGHFANLRSLGLSWGTESHIHGHWSRPAVEDLLRTATLHGIHILPDGEN
ncbi:hypothetical protein DXG01_000057 [Tephrocybe rancida]|nr:hypothetical protein DXG01_000057 [Tephrocybe rancida]